MNTHQVTLEKLVLLVPVKPGRGTPAPVQHWVKRFGRGLWRALESAGERRAARELLATAERLQSYRPELARMLREAAAFDATS